ncbi:DUF3108 domain-containing protein [Idiomarina seosinensis]|uniref:DUF3108 domain-containing protein n=1 Tax=Idiomarina seosinensis TaxID=281739 RepID=UPI00384F8B6B
MKKALALLLFCTSLAAVAEPVTLKPYEAEYLITRGGSEYGEGYRKLEVSPEGEWQLRGKTDISWFILSDVRETRSVFKYDRQSQSFEPMEFLYMRSGTGSDKSFHATFDADSKEIRNVDSGRLIDIQWQDELYDEASVIEKLRLDVANKAEPLEYPIIDEKGRADNYRYEILKEEKLTTPYGELNAVKVQRVRDTDRRQTFFWFAPELNYLLVQTRQFKEGEEQATMSLQKLQRHEKEKN